MPGCKRIREKEAGKALTGDDMKRLAEKDTASPAPRATATVWYSCAASTADTEREKKNDEIALQHGQPWNPRSSGSSIEIWREGEVER